MLHKAGTIVALTTAGLLAMSPLAFAGNHVNVEKQKNEQSSNQGNGILNGNNVASGNSVQVCNINVNALNNLFGAIAVFGSASSSQSSNVSQGGGNCKSSGSAIGQNTTQQAKNKKH